MHSKPNQPTRPPVKPGRPSSLGTEWALRSASTSAKGSATSRVSTTWPSSRTVSVWPWKAYAARRQADDRVTTKALAAFDGFKQVGIGAVGELQIDREWRVQVGQHFADDGNVGVAFSGLLLKLSVRVQDDFPSGTQRYGGGRRQRPPSPPTACGRKSMRGRQAGHPLTVSQLARQGNPGKLNHWTPAAAAGTDDSTPARPATGNRPAGASAPCPARTRRGSDGPARVRRPG